MDKNFVMSDYKKIFCVIPALNEEDRIGSVIDEVKKIIENIVVVDDGSNDNTAKIARERGAIVLSHILNRGQGAALQTGNQYALKNDAEIIFHFDADGQFFVEDIPEVLAPLLSGEADAVLGSRFMGKQSNMPFFKKKIIMPLARLFNNIFLGIKLTDPQSGFRALTAEAWNKIKIEQRGMAHASEILEKIVKNKLRVREVPIKVTYYRAGQGFFGGRGFGSGGIRVVKDTIIGKLVK